MVRVLFVCLGNICRSPTGEAVFKKMVTDAGLDDKITVDSCGTSANHEGEAADHRMQQHAQERGYDLTSVARGFRSDDFRNFDYILTMDNKNFDNIVRLDKDKAYVNRVYPMVKFCTKVNVDEVPDPYYGGPDGFEHVLDILEDGCAELLKTIEKGL